MLVHKGGNIKNWGGGGGGGGVQDGCEHEELKFLGKFKKNIFFFFLGGGGGGGVGLGGGESG